MAPRFSRTSLSKRDVNPDNAIEFISEELFDGNAEPQQLALVACLVCVVPPAGLARADARKLLAAKLYATASIPKFDPVVNATNYRMNVLF